MSKKNDENSKSTDWDFVKDDDEKGESGLKQFLMIAIPVGALLIVGVIVLFVAIGLITKLGKKANETQVTIEEQNEQGEGGSETSTVDKNGKAVYFMRLETANSPTK